jgi:ubiquinone/menaquinone biosynthesis C-methylase UbiE
MSRRAKVSLLLFGALCLPVRLYLTMAIVNTLNRLNEVESARDRWQKPDVILDALQLHAGDTVVDLGSGSGYFALRLAPMVGDRGYVLTTDVRRLSLFFLTIRAELKGDRNIHTVVATSDDARLPANAADAVLICNTFHEFADPLAILQQVRQALNPGGRLVVVDRSPNASPPAGGQHHVAIANVADQLQQSGFDVIVRNDRLLTDPDGDVWWLLIASKRS